MTMILIIFRVIYPPFVLVNCMICENFQEVLMTKKNSWYLGTNLKTKLSERFFFSIKKPILLV